MSVAEIFSNLFFIHQKYRNVFISCIFVLMEHETEITYRRVWEKVKETIKIRFETAYVMLSELTNDCAFFQLQPKYMASHSEKLIMLLESTKHEKNIYTQMVLKNKFVELLNYYEDTFIVQIELSYHFSFIYRINANKLKRESIKQIIKSNVC
ncbi:hypothetical protein HZS_1194 [Henneguya salminicola]|nr:hypothetical protein HZS_1194 [Henneguya salminicola]